MGEEEIGNSGRKRGHKRGPGPGQNDSDARERVKKGGKNT